MSTPTPSDFANRLTQQRLHEAEREEQIANLEKKLAKSSTDKHESTVRKNRARFGSGKERASTASHSSRRGKAPATSSKSTENQSNHKKASAAPLVDQKLNSSGTSSPTSNDRPSKDSRRTSRTKGSPKVTSTEKSEKQSPSSTPEQTSDSPKKVFVRKPHLTQRLSDNEALQELRASFPKPRHQNRTTRSSSKRK